MVNLERVKRIKREIESYANQLPSLDAEDYSHYHRINYLLNEIERLEGELEKEYE